MKKRFLFVFLLLGILTISGCGQKDKKLGTLSAPQEITVQSDGNKSLIIFDEVKNADYYNIYINDMSITVKSNGSGTVQFDASKIITLPQIYTIKVKAGASKYFDSKFSENYEYMHTSVLDAPVISIDGTTLNWAKVENAEFYDVLVKTTNPTLESIHRFPTNKFDFSNILTNKGEYTFRVRAVSENDEYLTSIYSNQVKYTHTIELITPYNLSTTYDLASGEKLLSFVSSENVTDFTININGANYNIGQTELNRFLYQDDFDNVYIIKLTSLIRSKEIDINNSQILNVSVKANAGGQYYKSSQVSNTIACQFTSVLSTPQINLTKTATTCKIDIIATPSEYLSGFAIYLNDQKYKTITKDVTQLELPLSELGTAGVRVQSVSNNNNCYSSRLSNVKYINDSIEALGITNISFENSTITWKNVENATQYYVEISNAIYKYCTTTTQTSFEITNICEPNNYNVRVIAMAEGFKQSEKSTSIIYTHKLGEIENINITSIADITYLTFNEVADCYGYVIYLNDVMVNRLFTTSQININPYIIDANSYKIRVQAVSVVGSNVENGNVSDEQILQNIKTLSSPLLSISKEEDKYYLNIDVNESESALASSYEIWINYVSIGKEAFQDTKIDITSYFANAGQYNFMVKANAIEGNEYIKDSSISSIIYTCTKQLDTVTDIKVTELADEGTYILTFKEQTLAAKYVVTIVKADDATYNVEFEINNGVADISEYVKANGVYRVYVKAIALQGGFYTDSATSGNPYRLTKGETLGVVSNVVVTKRTGGSSNGEIDVTWDKVENSNGYQVYVYYNNNGQNILKKSVYVTQSDNPSVNIGTGEYKCLNKEGLYTISIKALGDGELYETSQLSNTPYTYIMQSEADFRRNTIFMYGNIYDYKVTTLEELKHLLWYHYLYNEDIWLYNTLEYNLKIHCSLDLDQLANEISESFANQVLAVNTNAQKMDLIAKEMLKQYPEIAGYNDGLINEYGAQIQAFCLNEERNVYLFRYQDVLDKVKDKSMSTTNQVYGEKLDTVNTFDQRSTNYVFAIDTKDSIDVTTTEQLFMALQYNKSPNFVGDSEVAKTVYENARFILRNICTDDMSDYEKLLNIYNFLTKTIVYNSSVSLGNMNDTIMLGDGEYVKRGNVKQFYLESTLYNSQNDTGLFTTLNDIVGQSASSQALAKTFVVLCSIEGITSIKVDGTANGEKYSWNKVYVDIEEDGVEGKCWYVIDLTSAIRNQITITKSESVAYQTTLHKYFLITDAVLNAQANTWHTPLGNTTDYKASVVFNYYENERYSTEYNEITIVSNKNFKATDDNDVKHALIYAMLKANKKHRVMVDIDAEDYIRSIVGNSTDSSALSTVTSKITNTIYETARGDLGGQYNCNVTATIVDAKYIIIAVESVNYGKQ